MNFSLGCKDKHILIAVNKKCRIFSFCGGDNKKRRPESLLLY